MILGETLSLTYGCSQLMVYKTEKTDRSDIDNLQTDLNRLGEGAVEN